MKKIIAIFALFSLVSCRENDKIISAVIDQSQSELNNYNHIRRMTQDTNIINFIDSLKRNEFENALEVRFTLKTSNSFINPLDSSIEKINIYIDTLKK